VRRHGVEAAGHGAGPDEHGTARWSCEDRRAADRPGAAGAQWPSLVRPTTWSPSLRRGRRPV